MIMPAVLGGTRVRLLARLVANGLAQGLAALATALVVRFAFDHLIGGSSPLEARFALWVGLGLLAAAGLTAWLRMLERTDAERLGQDYILQVRLTLFDRLSALAPRALQRHSRGATMLRFVGDLSALRQWVSLGLSRLTVAGVSSLAALLALATINAILALTVGVALLAGVLLSVGLGQRMQHAVREARRRQSYLAANVNEKIASMTVVQVFGQSRRERRRVGRQSRRLKEAMIRRAHVTGRLRAVTEATAALASGAALLVGAGEVAVGEATAGTVVAAMTIVGLLVPPLRDLGRVYEYWQSARVSAEKIDDFLATPSLVEQAPDAVRLKRGPGHLEFRGASVAGALAPFRAVVPAGSVVALVGPNGSGKSTLLSLAARLIDPDQGEVLLDGQDLARAKLSSLRRNIGMVGPELPLLRGTIEKNLRYRWPDAPAEELEQVIRLCGVDEVLAELPDGLQTRLTEGGANLSLGQRQRIALARAILGGPRILLLDEADANLDPRSAAVLDRVLGEFGGTVLMVTHRLERLDAADIVWHLDRGRLIESGCAGGVLQNNGPTAHLFGLGWALAS